MTDPSQDLVGREIGTYQIQAYVGAGGMGAVYLAHDRKLDRPVALKLLSRALADDPDRLHRFHQEARAASSLNHPHILVVHDFGEINGHPFIVTEFIEGQTLRRLLDAGPLPLPTCVDVAAQVASALAAAHARGIVHRDIKPQNVMVRPDGYVKVLDFGLAKLLYLPAAQEASTPTLHTQPGVVMGTPYYMSPEQVRGERLDGRSDLWSLGVVFFEMLTGRLPFAGGTTADVMADILRSPLPDVARSDVAIPGAVTSIVQRLLSKDPQQRFASAAEVERVLHDARRQVDSGTYGAEEPRLGLAGTAPTAGAPLPRCMVLPFRMLKADSDVDFLAYSLPDALVAALGNLKSLVVRSSLAAARFSADSDFRIVAQEAAVDFVLSGTVLRVGDRLRITTQLVEGHEGTLVWSHSAHGSLNDLFELQDSCVEAIVQALAVPLTNHEQRLLKRDVPVSPKAYELFLRANEIVGRARLWSDAETWTVARDLYSRSLDEDPRFAPAWAAVARVYRVMAKSARTDSRENMARAENAVKRALELNPELSRAQMLYAQLENDMGRARDAMSRLLHHARYRSSDPDLFAGLSHACRYCGLLDASIAAHERAVRLDPRMTTTGVSHTYFLLGDYAQAIDFLERSGVGYGYVGLISLVCLGRKEEALVAARAMENTAPPQFRAILGAARALAEGNHDASAAALDDYASGPIDPEGLFYVARQFAYLGETRRALDALERSIQAGFSCYASLARHPWFNSIRAEPGFPKLLERYRQGRDAALTAFLEAGGASILGLALERS